VNILALKRDPSTYFFHINLDRIHNTTTPPTLYMTCFRFWSEKVVAFCRLAISSNWGCRHVPVTGVAGEPDLGAGVTGATGAGIFRCRRCNTATGYINIRKELQSWAR
jgi:hypothetical protein